MWRNQPAGFVYETFSWRGRWLQGLVRILKYLLLASRGHGEGTYARTSDKMHARCPSPSALHTTRTLKHSLLFFFRRAALNSSMKACMVTHAPCICTEKKGNQSNLSMLSSILSLIECSVCVSTRVKLRLFLILGCKCIPKNVNPTILVKISSYVYL